MHQNDENKGEEGCGGCMCQRMAGAGFREFKIAKLEKKAKILEAELEFVNKIKEMVKKMPSEPTNK